MKPSVIAGMMLAVLQASAAAAPQPVNATLRGIVLATGTDDPVAGAQLTLTTFSSVEPRFLRKPAVPAVPPVTTDRAGRFIIEGVGAGAYRLTIMRNGYVKQEYGKRVSNGPVSRLELTDSETKDLVIRLTPTGSVSGVIRNMSGRPVAGVDVQLIQRTYSEMGDRSLSTIVTTQTNDRGEYRFYWVSPGRYYVMAGETNRPRLSKTENHDRGVEHGVNLVQSNYVAAYYPGVRDIERAVSVEIQPGTELRAIDLTLDRGRLFHIRGRVVDSTTGKVPDWVRIEFYEDAHGYGYEIAGELEIPDLVPGTYWARVMLENSDRATTSKFVIFDSDIEGFVLTLPPPSVVTGQIHVDGELQELTALDDLALRLRPAEPGRPVGEFGSFLVLLQPKGGAFTLGGIADGEFRVTLSALPPGLYLKEARLDGVDVLNAPALFRSGKLEVVVSSKGGRIDGIVSDDRSLPMSNAQAVLVPNGSRNRFELFKSVTTDKAGRFSMIAIPPGDYALFAWEALEPYSWFDPDVLKQYEARGQAVHVSESSSQSIEARMIPAEDAR